VIAYIVRRNCCRLYFRARSYITASFSPGAAANYLLDHLAHGRAVDTTAALRAAMTQSLGGSDPEGAWDWKGAYDPCEAATVLFLRKVGRGMRTRADTPAALLGMLSKLAVLLPSQTHRSEESQALQQFSTPITYGFVASTAAAITETDLVLEPSAPSARATLPGTSEFGRHGFRAMSGSSAAVSARPRSR